MYIWDCFRLYVHDTIFGINCCYDHFKVSVFKRLSLFMIIWNINLFDNISFTCTYVFLLDSMILCICTMSIHGSWAYTNSLISCLWYVRHWDKRVFVSHSSSTKYVENEQLWEISVNVACSVFIVLWINIIKTLTEEMISRCIKAPFAHVCKDKIIVLKKSTNILLHEKLFISEQTFKIYIFIFKIQMSKYKLISTFIH